MIIGQYNITKFLMVLLLVMFSSLKLLMVFFYFLYSSNCNIAKLKNLTFSVKFMVLGIYWPHDIFLFMRLSFYQ